MTLVISRKNCVVFFSVWIFLKSLKKCQLPSPPLNSFLYVVGLTGLKKFQTAIDTISSFHWCILFWKKWAREHPAAALTARGGCGGSEWKGGIQVSDVVFLFHPPPPTPPVSLHKQTSGWASNRVLFRTLPLKTSFPLLLFPYSYYFSFFNPCIHPDLPMNWTGSSQEERSILCFARTSFFINTISI